MSKGARTVRVLPFERDGYVWPIPEWLDNEKIAEVSYRSPVREILLYPMRRDDLFDAEDAVEGGFPHYAGIPTAYTVAEGKIWFNIRPLYNGALRIVTEDRR